MKTIFKFNAMGTNPEALMVDLFHAGLSDNALEQIGYVENNKGYWTVGFTGVPSTALLTLVLAHLLKMFSEVTWENDRLDIIIFKYGTPAAFSFDIDNGITEPMRIAASHERGASDFTHEGLFHTRTQQGERYAVDSVAALVRQRRIDKLLDSENAGV